MSSSSCLIDQINLTLCICGNFWVFSAKCSISLQTGGVCLGCLIQRKKKRRKYKTGKESYPLPDRGSIDCLDQVVPL